MQENEKRKYRKMRENMLETEKKYSQRRTSRLWIEEEKVEKEEGKYASMKPILRKKNSLISSVAEPVQSLPAPDNKICIKQV